MDSALKRVPAAVIQDETDRLRPHRVRAAAAVMRHAAGPGDACRLLSALGLLSASKDDLTIYLQDDTAALAALRTLRESWREEKAASPAQP